MHRAIKIATLFLAAGLYGQDSAALTKLLDRVFENERVFLQDVRTRTPLLETYIQETGEIAPDTHASRDHYYLGRLGLLTGVKYTPIAVGAELSKVCEYCPS
jgi:hypothetical protein